MSRTAVLILLTLALRASPVGANVEVERNKSITTLEFALGAAGLALGVENGAQALHGSKSFVPALVGLGLGAGSLALSMTREAELQEFDLVAGSVAILGSILRLRSVNATMSHLSPGSSLVTVRVHF